MTVDKRQVVWDHIKTGVWRVTHPERLATVLEHGCVAPDADAPDRVNLSCFPAYVRYVLNGVSLFEFGKYRDEETRLNAAWGWDWAIPYPERCGWDSALWLEIDAAGLGDKYIDVDALDEICFKYICDTLKMVIIDLDIEAACRGDLPPAAIKSAYVVGSDIDWHEVYRRDPL